MNHILNIAFDGKTPSELKSFIIIHREIFLSYPNLTIKINDLIAEIGIE